VKDSGVKDSPSSPPPFASEDALLAWLREIDPELKDWIGDDTALLPDGGSRVATVDTQIEGTHYPRGLDPDTVARRLVAVNLSDLAAAGALPAYGFLSLATPKGFDHRSFFTAFLQECRQYSFQLAGGDLASTSNAVASLTLLGEIPEGGRWVSRKEARAGDSLWLGGQVGGSALGRFLLAEGHATWQSGEVSLAETFDPAPILREAAERAVRAHLSPTPQLDLGLWLGRQDRAAAIDISDGLGKDLGRLCESSGVGARIEVGSLPLPSEIEKLTKFVQKSRLEITLAGGEDYVLLFSLPSSVQPPANFQCHRIGVLTHEPEIEWLGLKRLTSSEDPAQSSSLLQGLGWDHLKESR